MASSCINKRINRIKPSATFQVKAQAKALETKGHSIIDLSVGEPDFDTPDFIKEAAARALKQGLTKYAPVAGYPNLRKALAKKLREENLINASPDEIIVCLGGKQALHNLFQVSLEPGDEVLIPVPYWVSYPPMVELAGGVVRFLETRAEDSYKVQAAALNEALNSKTKYVIINSPSNPTGTTYSESELKELGAVIEKSAALVVSDEVYEKCVFGDFKFSSFAAAVPHLAERTITLNSFSKTWSMTGWRVGYLHAPKEIVQGN